MIVVDASALLEMLLHTEAAEAVAERLLAQGDAIHAPHLLDVEVAQVLRRWATRGMIDADQGKQAIEELAEYPIHRHAHSALLPRVWDLRANLSAYDAVYVALAEAKNAPLLTRDRRLGRACAGTIAVELV